MPLVTPLYYTHPETEEAYACPQEYWFGSELIAAPFTAPMPEDLGLSRQRVWLPEGDWFDLFTGEHFGGGWNTVYGDLAATPVFAQAGAIVPIGPKVGWGGIANPETMYLHVFPGADNRFELYEDDGETVDYKRGKYALTPIEQTWRGSELALTIGPVSGDAAVVPPTRTWTIAIHGIIEPSAVTLTANEHPATAAGVSYDPMAEAFALTLQLAASDSVRLVLTTGAPSLLQPARPAGRKRPPHAAPLQARQPGQGRGSPRPAAPATRRTRPGALRLIAGAAGGAAECAEANLIS